MNKHDMDNVNFILSLNEREFDKWANSISQDDLDYAIEIIKARRLELAAEEASYFDEVENVSEANAILKKFML